MKDNITPIKPNNLLDCLIKKDKLILSFKDPMFFSIDLKDITIILVHNNKLKIYSDDIEILNYTITNSTKVLKYINYLLVEYYKNISKENMI